MREALLAPLSVTDPVYPVIPVDGGVCECVMGVGRADVHAAALPLFPSPSQENKLTLHQHS